MPLNYDLLKLTPPASTLDYMSAKDYMAKARGLREEQRKYAIERALQEGYTSSDSKIPDMATVRASLIKSGFAEDAERLEQEITGKRRETTEDVAKKALYLDLLRKRGLVDDSMIQGQYNDSVTRTDAPIAAPSQIGVGVPQQSMGTSAPMSSTTEDGVVHITANTPGTNMPVPFAASSEPTYTRTNATNVPGFLAGMVKFKDQQTAPVAPTVAQTGGVEYIPPTDPKDAQRVLTTARNLGYGGDISGINAWLDTLAEASVPKEVHLPKGMDVDAMIEAEQAQALADSKRSALVQDSKLKLSSAIKAGRDNEITQAIAKASLGLAQAADKRATAKESRETEGITARENPYLSSDVATQEARTEAETRTNNYITLSNKAQKMLDDIAKGIQPSLPNLLDYAKDVAREVGDGTTIDAYKQTLSRFYGGTLPKDVAAKLERIIKNEPQTKWNALITAMADPFFEGHGVDSRELKQAAIEVGLKARSKRGMGQIVANDPIWSSYTQQSSKPKPSSPSAADAMRGRGVGAKKTEIIPSTPKKYTETKTNSDGDRMGKRAADGKWEVVR